MKTFIQIKPLSFLQKLAIVFLMVLMLVPINYFFYPPNQVEAGPTGGPVTVVGDVSATGIKTAVESTLTTANTFLSSIGITSLAMKEGFWDGIFNMAAKVFLRAMVRSIIVWINSGFKGAPTFVTDLKGFLLDVADEVVGEFIYNNDALNFLCSPFQLDIKIALATQYSTTRADNYQPQCTLSGVVDNVDGFLSGNFADGGWPGFIELATSEDSNPTTAYLRAEAEMYARIIDAQGREIKKLDFGNGFFSIETCDIAEKQSGSKPNCTIGTPGSVIANSINKALGAGQDELIAADEVNEIFNALFSQLVQQLFKGAYGLLGLGGNPSYTDYNWDGNDSGTSYLDAVANEDANQQIDTSFVGQISPINQSLNFTREYLTLQYEIVGRVDAAEIEYNNTKSDLEAQSCTISFGFPTTLNRARTNAQREIANASTTLTLLTLMDQQWSSASSTANDQQVVLDQFQQLNSAGMLYAQNDVVQAELFIDYNLQIEVDDLDQKLTQEQNRCQST